MDEWMRAQGWTGAETPMNLYWGHSHVNMGVFWSGQDEECIESFLNFTGTGVLASVVYNKKGEWKARVDVGVGIGGNIEQWTKEAEMQVQEIDYETRAECEREVRELVTVGVAPKRDLTDDRLRAIDEAEKKEEAEKRGGQGRIITEYRGSEFDGYSEGWVHREGGAYTAFTVCTKCPAEENCASPVINPRQIGCTNRQCLVPLTALAGRHWKQAKANGREKELQSWRDRMRAKAVEASTRPAGTPSAAVAQSVVGAGAVHLLPNRTGLGSKMCRVGACTRVLWPVDGACYVVGICEKCVALPNLPVKAREEYEEVMTGGMQE
jgi:hypothetical protein